MKLKSFLIFCVPFLLAVPLLAQSELPEKPFENAPDVVGLWRFDGNAQDASGNGHDGKLRGKDSRFVKDGKFGGALLVEGKVQKGDKRQGVVVENTDALNPAGAFTLEMWISPGNQLAETDYAVLLDKKYYIHPKKDPETNTAYTLGLTKSDDQFRLDVRLGFGDQSATVLSLPQTLEAGKWYHIAFTYDGKGLCTFYLNAKQVGQTQLKNRGALAAGTQPLVIGDRKGSLGHRFYGRIDEVRILNKATEYLSGKVLLDAEGSRTAFYRMEKDATALIRVHNDSENWLKSATLQYQIADSASKTVRIPDLEAGKSTSVPLPIDTTLRPDTYKVSLSIENAGDAEKVELPITIAKRPLPNQMPIIMWGHSWDYDEVTDIGYTGQLVYMPVASDPTWDYIWNGKNLEKPDANTRITSNRKELDEMLAVGLDGMLKPQPGKYLAQFHPDYNRVDKTGKRVDTKSSTNGMQPRVQQFARDTGTVMARVYGDMPAWKGTLIDSEVRELSTPSFSDADRESYKKFSGRDIPSNIGGGKGVNYKAIPNFPDNRILPDNEPTLQYYRWFWTKGNGWDQILSEVSDGIRTNGRPDVFTWYDPAVRSPSIWGSGGNVDMINQWTYTYPNPISADLATNELFAMADGRPGQKVMNMIQIIWKRDQIAKKPEKGKESDWEKAAPDVKYMSIAPDHLSEATWLELSHPVSAIANHGWGALGKELGYKQGAYQTTHTGARERMKELLNNVVKPLAPTLLQVPDYKTDIAFLESFTSQMFDTVGSYGWGRGWVTQAYFIARYAGLQPKVIYEQAIEQGALERYKVLFLTDVSILPQSVADAIKEFQRNGGIVIGDEDTVPGIHPDILLAKMSAKVPAETKKLYHEKAETLLEELGKLYQPPLESSNPDIITRLRQYKNSAYIFTINDHRTYGDYVGQYKKVMEKGVPSQGQIALNTKPDGAVYDLINHRQVPTTRIYGKVQFPVDLAAGGGNLFLVTDKPVGKLWVTVPENAQRGRLSQLKVQLNDVTGGQMEAVVPMTVTITDPEGRSFEKSGYYGAADGRLEIDLELAPNDTSGLWQVEVAEALTGQKDKKTFRVQ